MKMYWSVLIGMLVFFVGHTSVWAEQPIHIYLDADRTGTRDSGVAIERGIMVALDEVDYKIAGHPVTLLACDHHGSAVRSKRHLREYLADDNALAVYSGLHSPPLLENLAYIHDKGILILDPWAAAGPITRYPSEKNWVYRLSVDDTKAAEVIVANAIGEGFSKPYLLLEETGWGKSNYKTMTKALAKRNLFPVGVQWFNWNLGETGAKMMLRNMHAAEADVVLMVANAPEGKTFARAMLALEKEDPNMKPLPIRSHWGITGGDFPREIRIEMRSRLDLKFLQTRFSFVSSPSTRESSAVLERAKRVYPRQIRSAADITAPTGFIHAYDLTKLFIAAVEKAQLTGDIVKDREAVRVAMENLDQPISGLIKTYQRPFTTFSPDQPDAHEALDSEDFVMGYYDAENRIILVEEQQK